MLMVAAAGKTLERRRRRCICAFFTLSATKPPASFLILFWRRGRFEDYPRTGIFPFASLFRLRSLLFRRVSPPPFSFPPLPLMEWLGLDPLIVISGSFFFFFFHPACIGQGSLYLAQRTVAERRRKNWDSYSSLFAASCCEENVCCPRMASLRRHKKLAKLYTLAAERKTAKRGGDREIFCFFTS